MRCLLIQGTLFVAIVRQDGTLIGQKNVNWRWADAQFPDLPPGQYRAIAFRESVNPPEAFQDVTLGTNELYQVRVISPTMYSALQPQHFCSRKFRISQSVVLYHSQLTGLDIT